MITPTEGYLVVVPGSSCPVPDVAGGASLRCWWEEGMGEWQALHVHVGVEQQQVASECALMSSLDGSCVVGARMNGKWTWDDKCNDD